MAEFTEQEKLILEEIKKQVPPEQFEKLMQLPVEQVKEQLAMLMEQQKGAQQGQERLFCNIVSLKESNFDGYTLSLTRGALTTRVCSISKPKS